MYPTIFDFLNELLGTSIQFPIQTFGFFVALAFLAANFVIKIELQRFENAGILLPKVQEIEIGQKPSTNQMVLRGILGFVLGFKIGAIFLNYQAFAQNTQAFIFSSEGSFLGGIIGAALLAYLYYYEANKKALPEVKKEQVKVFPHQLVGNITIIAAISGLIGAKLFHNFEYWDEFILDPWGSLLSFSGLTFYGGLILGSASVLYYAHINNISLLRLIDAAVPALMLAYGVGRLGCHFSGDGDWGIVNALAKPLSWIPDWAWSYTYPHNVISEGILIPGCSGPHCYALAQGVWPTPLYEAIVCIGLFGLLWVLRKRIQAPGMLFGIYLFINGMERFFIEKIRVNAIGNYLGMNITQAEFISFVLMLLGIGLSSYFYSLYKKNARAH
jgi:phosphatidylglycerol---prolipoprotein diacylglyceryl transferase